MNTTANKGKRGRSTTSWKSVALALKLDLEVARNKQIELEMENLDLKINLDAANRKAEALLSDRASLAREMLLRSMREIAERHFGMPFFIGMGLILWSEVNSPEKMALSKSEAMLLKKLSSWAGGWWSIEPGDTEMRFVDIDRWVKDYEQYSRKTGEHTS